MIAQFRRFDQNFILCSHPPICVLFQRDEIRHQPFLGISRDCIPVFSGSFTVDVGNMRVTRHQVPIGPAFALTEYKVQGSTYDYAVLDLSRKSRAYKENALHKRYCSVYVQLSRLRSLRGLHLLQPLTLNDLQNKMHRKLHEEDCRLEQLAVETMRLMTV